MRLFDSKACFDAHSLKGLKLGWSATHCLSKDELWDTERTIKACPPFCHPRLLEVLIETFLVLRVSGELWLSKYGARDVSAYCMSELQLTRWIKKNVFMANWSTKESLTVMWPVLFGNFTLLASFRLAILKLDLCGIMIKVNVCCQELMQCCHLCK